MSHAMPWWKQTTVYQIYPRSFFDSNGDGIGDLQGIQEKLDVLEELGVETLWCSPFFASPQADFGYDISDYLSIAPEYGTLEECQSLIDEVHRRGMKIVFDLVMNHTSEQHAWFRASRSSRSDPKRDWYIWRDGQKAGGAAPPNNWKSMIGGSGWHYDAATDQWYWATFLPFQPDLNYRNPEVKEAMFGIVRELLGMGVDGFRLDIFNAIHKDPSFANNPWSWRPIPTESHPDGFFQKNLHTINHPDTFAFAKELRAVVDEFEDRFLVGEVFGTPEILRKYCGDDDGLHMVFLFETLKVAPKARALRRLLTDFEEHFPKPLVPTYVFGNHDRPRRLGRLAQDEARKARMLATFQMTARGVPFIYYGEEIGLPPTALPLKGALDPMAGRYSWVPELLARGLSWLGILLNRDGCRTPMQWDDSPHAGFSSATPWLPVHPDYESCNVASQREDRDSLWSCYQRLLKLRKEHPPLHRGELNLLPRVPAPNKMLAYERVAKEYGATSRIRVLFNCSERSIYLPVFWGQGKLLFSSFRHFAHQPLPQLKPYEAVIIEL